MSPALVPELTVSDLGASLRFYCDLLGFMVKYERAEEGFVYLQLGAADLMLDQRGVGRDWTTGELDHPFGRGINIQIEVPALPLCWMRSMRPGGPCFSRLKPKPTERERAIER